MFTLEVVCSGLLVLVCEIVEVGDLDHVARHVGGPLQDLGPDVVEEGVGSPSTKDLDAVWCVVQEGEGHRGAASNGFGADFVWVEAEYWLATVELAGVAE